MNNFNLKGVSFDRQNWDKNLSSLWSNHGPVL